MTAGSRCGSGSALALALALALPLHLPLALVAAAAAVAAVERVGSAVAVGPTRSVSSVSSVTGARSAASLKSAVRAEPCCSSWLSAKTQSVPSSQKSCPTHSRAVSTWLHVSGSELKWHIYIVGYFLHAPRVFTRSQLFMLCCAVRSMLNCRLTISLHLLPFPLDTSCLKNSRSSARKTSKGQKEAEGK